MQENIFPMQTHIAWIEAHSCGKKQISYTKNTFHIQNALHVQKSIPWTTTHIMYKNIFHVQMYIPLTKAHFIYTHTKHISCM